MKALNAAIGRDISPHDSRQRMRLTALALAAGAGLGLANLAANWSIASADPALRALLVQRFTAMDPLVAVVIAPLQEEIIFRLILMSALAWLAMRFTRNPATVFVSALLGSSFAFGLAHLGRPLPLEPGLADFYRLTLVLKYTIAGLPLGWIFWRWGLPYGILCHAASNAAHLLAQGIVFAS